VRLLSAAIYLTALPLAFAQPDPKTLLLQSIQNYQRDWRSGMNWACTQTDVSRSDGASKTDVYEVIPLDGTPYDKLVQKDGHPLSPDERRREDEKFEKTARERERESTEERQDRIRKYEDQRSFLKDIPNAYDFRMAGDDVVDGRPAWVLTMTPRAGFVPTTPRGGMLKHIEGKLWIDKQDIQWARAEARVIEPISIGWILARIGAGAKITLRMTRVVNGLWLLEKIDVEGEARVLMVHNKDLDEHVTFSGYRPAASSNVITRGANR
jgi:hypothetical protein